MTPHDQNLLFLQSEISDYLETLSALSDPDRLQVYLFVRAAGGVGVTIEEICARLGFVQRRTALALRWLKRAQIVTVDTICKPEKITINIAGMEKLKSIL